MSNLSQRSSADIRLLVTCPRNGCFAPMGALRPYVGSSPAKAHNRGRLCQTCTNKGVCFATVYHSEERYHFAQAEAFCTQWYAARDGSRDFPLFPEALPPLSVPAPASNPPSPTPAGRAATQILVSLCTNSTCPGNKKAKANRDCVDTLCGPDTRRGRCKAHKTQEVVPTVSQPFPQPEFRAATNTNSQPTQPEHDDPFLVTTQPPVGAPSQPPIVSNPGIPCMQACPIPAHTAPSTQENAPSNANTERRPLARPMAESWVNAHKDARLKTENVKDQKQKQQEMARIARSTISITFYHTANRDPLKMKHILTSWPHFQLNELTTIMAGLKLTKDSDIDFYDAGQWTLVKPVTVISVERNTHLLFRARPSIFEGITDSECPGIRDEYSRSLVKPKRAGSPLLAEHPKMARTSDARPDIQLNDPDIDPALALPTEHASLPFEDDIPTHEVQLSIVPATHSNRMPSPAPFPMTLPNQISRSKQSTRAKESKRRLKQAERVSSKITSYASAQIKEGEEKPRFPRDFYACDVRDGLEYLERLKGANLQVKDVFSKVFLEASYKRATISDCRKFMREQREMFEKFASLGRKPGAVWEKLQKAVMRKAKKTRKASSRADSDTGSDSCSENDSDLGAYKALDHDQQGPSDFVDPEGPVTSDDEDVRDRCSYCDAFMPSNPSSKLIEMEKELIGVTRPDPRPYNRKGRTADSFQVHSAYCAQHKYESIELPKAKANGWPLDIAFNTLDARLRDLEDVLRDVVNDVKASEFFSIALKARGPGSSKSAGFETFTDFGAGYYGELGYQIIQLLLYRMFPMSALDLSAFAPLPYSTFIGDVLIPEAVVLLISEDLTIGYDDSVRTLRASRSFGLIAHPADEDNPIFRSLNSPAANAANHQ